MGILQVPALQGQWPDGRHGPTRCPWGTVPGDGMDHGGVGNVLQSFRSETTYQVLFNCRNSRLCGGLSGQTVGERLWH